MKLEDVTPKVRELYEITAAEIDEALAFISSSDIDHAECSCIYKSRANHCDTFSYFNPNVPSPSIYSLPRLSDKKRKELLDQDVIDILDIPEDFSLSDKQNLVFEAARKNQPQIDLPKIKKIIGDYEFPLYFFDYETYSSAVPFIDGTSPHKHFPVQYSLHILSEDGTLAHKEFLQRTPQLPENLINQMEQDFGPDGSIVSWHASFEKKRNEEMAQLFPHKADFLNQINERMVDLEDIFKSHYIDARFDGSSSIKKVLPVICPELKYSELDIQDGSSAMDAWFEMIISSPEDADIKAKELLEYCHLDTFAMVEIYRFLAKL